MSAVGGRHVRRVVRAAEPAPSDPDEGFREINLPVRNLLSGEAGNAGTDDALEGPAAAWAEVSRISNRQGASAKRLDAPHALNHVGGVRDDHFSGSRFRHGTRVLLWRPDNPSTQCTYAQVRPLGNARLARRAG